MRLWIVSMVVTTSSFLSALAVQIDAAKIARDALPAVVALRGITTDSSVTTGTGFIIHESGTVVTNLHVIAKWSQGSIRLKDGDTYDSFLIKGVDERRDLAILQIPGFKLPTLTLGDSDDLQAGTPIVLIGNPFELEGSITTGVISAVRPWVSGFRVIQTDAAANPGNSGGPMLDSEGRAVGVMSFGRRDGENVNFAIPINYVRGLLQAQENLRLEDLHIKLSQSTIENPASDPDGYFPVRWKDVDRGTIYRLRRSGDYLYAEVELPVGWHQAGAFGMAELKRSGASYKGALRWRNGCTFPSMWDGSAVANFCSFSFNLEVTSVTPTRMEGYSVSPSWNAKLNCRRCSFSEPFTPQRFVLIPE